MSSNSNPSVDELLALLDAAEAEPTPGHPLDPKMRPKGLQGFHAAFSTWAGEFDLQHGRSVGVVSSDLYRHFTEWTKYRGESFSPNVRTWGQAMSGLGLLRGRVFADGRDSRPYLLTNNAAKYFRGWVRDNPAPPVGDAMFAIRRKSNGTFSPESKKNQRIPEEDE